MEQFYKVLDEMSEEDFYERVIQGIGKSHEMSKVIAGGIGLLKPEEKEHLIEMLRDLGAPDMNDNDIKKICCYISEDRHLLATCPLGF